MADKEYEASMAKCVKTVVNDPAFSPVTVLIPFDTIRYDPPAISEAVWSAMTPEVRHSVAAAIRRAVTHAASQNKRSNPLPMISGSESNYSDESQDSDTEDSAEEQSGDDSLVIVTLHLLRFER